ncbi:MAG: rhodanese-like domain-containing protein [Bdellovibrionales bacterium]|nr:rhodanese-like domain-containing protein [Bdellovibrionales bacterium]
MFKVIAFGGFFVFIALGIFFIYPKLSLAEFATTDVVKKAVDSGALVIDVRTPQEFESGHAKEAINVPYDEIVDNPRMLQESKDRAIIVYCRSGRRSSIAKSTLESLGFRNILNAGGVSEMEKASCFGC